MDSAVTLRTPRTLRLPQRRTVGLGGIVVAATVLADLATGASVELMTVFLLANLLQLVYLQRALPAVRAGSPDRVRTALRSAARGSTGSRVEGIALIAASVDLCWLVFAYADLVTLSLLLLALSAWAGIRFSPSLVGVHGVAMAVVGVALTAFGVGPFAGEHAGAPGALLVQTFVATATTLGLVVAFRRRERA